MTEQVNHFTRLSSINVSEHIEKKGGFSYLSWPFAVSELRNADPAAVWEIRRFNGLPYLATELGVFVEVAVTVQGITLSQIHPVLDGRNRPILAPNAFDINSSLQRCLVKAIALHGLGLYVYAGEDLPHSTQESANESVTTRQPTASHGAQSVLATVSPQQQVAIQKLAIEVGADLNRILQHFGVRYLRDVPAAQFARVIRALEKRRVA